MAWHGVDVHCAQHTPPAACADTSACRAALRLFAALSLVDDDVAAEFKARLLATDLVLYTLRALATCMVRPVSVPPCHRQWARGAHRTACSPRATGRSASGASHC